MSDSFFFYDLETTGLDARSDRIMQFAGQRTDTELNPIGEPYNCLIKLSDDTLPSPDALMVTGISPQKTVEEGYTEAEFARMFTGEIATPGTTMLGYNTTRFDDEFIRALLWRNFYDPYEWSYKKGRSRWDILDAVRMTRALRPAGIEWPVTSEGMSTNRLELLTKANGIDHESAHDALSDVNASIAVAQLLRQKQPQLFSYLLSMRDKKAVKALVNLDDPKPFVYTSGRYEVEFEKTTIAYPLCEAPHGNLYVYDLRYDPSEWIEKSPVDISEIMATPYAERDESYKKLPIKKLQYNRCPAVAPLGVLKQHDGWSTIQLESDLIQRHIATLRANPHFGTTIQEAFERVQPTYDSPDAESSLYDGFVSNRDALRAETVRSADAGQIARLEPSFDDARLAALYPRYKVRNFPSAANDTDREAYEKYRNYRLSTQMPGFMKRLQAIAGRNDLSQNDEYILEELKLWFEAIVPLDELGA